MPTASSESQYRSGLEMLRHYNKRVAEGQATFDRRSDNLLETIERFALDLGSMSAAVDHFIDDRSAFAFLPAARLYYENKGRLYAYYIIMQGLERDFAGVIKEKQLQSVWEQAMASLKEGMELDNFFIINAAADNQVLPSHLAGQGFYIMRTRTQLREISNVLLK